MSRPFRCLLLVEFSLHCVRFRSSIGSSMMFSETHASAVRLPSHQTNWAAVYFACLELSPRLLNKGQRSLRSVLLKDRA